MKMPELPYVLVTGGAGFIGTNLTSRLAEQKQNVLVFDNLSRAGVENNLKWLLETYPNQVTHWNGDVRNFELVKQAVRGAKSIFHLAAQVAVTTSLVDPIYDFEVNARGTLNILEAMRELSAPPSLLYTSTNKVFGGLESVEFTERTTRYEPKDEKILKNGISESWPTEFCSPYGCSKGAADQYVLDFARVFDLPAVVFRMSCIYGPHQYGNEDQGWVAHFVRRAIGSQAITFYGDGKQVRDALFVGDLIDAFLLAQENIQKVKGRPFNIGGGTENTTSLIELVELIGKIKGKRPDIDYQEWRPSDQKYYVSDVSAFRQETGWNPKTNINDGVAQLHSWALSKI
jgi:CDP-paratose 2-epimerase